MSDSYHNELVNLGYAQGYRDGERKGRADAIEECFSKIEDRFNDDTTVSFDLPIEEILGEEIDVDDFCMLAEEIVQQYKSLIFQKLREAKEQLKSQKT